MNMFPGFLAMIQSSLIVTALLLAEIAGYNAGLSLRTRPKSSLGIIIIAYIIALIAVLIK
jgi:Mn2+/Fe2+ NRAMP family transporter